MFRKYLRSRLREPQRRLWPSPVAPRPYRPAIQPVPISNSPTARPPPCIIEVQYKPAQADRCS